MLLFEKMQTVFISCDTELFQMNEPVILRVMCEFYVCCLYIL